MQRVQHEENATQKQEYMKRKSDTKKVKHAKRATRKKYQN